MATPRRSVAMFIVLIAAVGPTGRAGDGPESKPIERRDLHGDPLPPGALVRLGTIRYRQDSPIYRIAWTPDGKQFVTDGEDSILRVWDADEGRVVRRIDPGVGALEDFAITGNGKLAMAVGQSIGPGVGLVQNVTLTHLGNGRIEDRGSWHDPRDGFHPVAICPERRLIAIGAEPSGIRLLDVWNGAEVGRLETGDQKAELLVFSRGGRRLCAASDRFVPVLTFEETFRIYDLERKQDPKVLRRRGGALSDLAFSPDSGTLAEAATDALDLWDVASGERASLGRPYVHRFDYSDDGRGLAGVSIGGEVKVFDPAARKIVSSSPSGMGKPDEVALSPDGRTLLVVGEGQVLHAWDIRARRDRFAMPDTHAGEVETIAIAPDATTILTGGEDGTIRLWEAGTGKPGRMHRLPGRVGASACSPDGRRMAAATFLGHRIAIWDLPARTDPLVLAYAVGDIIVSPLALHFLDADTVLLLDSGGKTFRVDIPRRRVAPGTRLQLSEPGPIPIPGMPEQLASIRLSRAAFLPDGKRVITRGVFTAIHLFDLETGKEIRRFGDGNQFAASPDGRLIAVAHGDSPAGGKEKRLSRTLGRLSGLATIAAGAEIALVEAETGRELQRIRVEGSQAWALAFSPDGKTLAATSGWESGEIHLFDVETGRKVRAIAAPPTRSPALAFTPDGSRLVSGMADGSVLVWDVRAGR